MNNAPPPTGIYDAGFDPPAHWLPPRLPPNPNALGAWPIPPESPLYAAYHTAGMAAAAYHGYKRNQSVGWALVWGLFGAAFPVLTNVIALAEGYGKPQKRG